MVEQACPSCIAEGEEAEKAEEAEEAEAEARRHAPPEVFLGTERLPQGEQTRASLFDLPFPLPD